MKKTALILMALMVFTGAAIAQKGKITGTVKDATTGETLPFTNVLYGDGKGTSADLDGKYSLELDYGTYTLKVSMVGYENYSATVKLDKGTVVHDISMKNKSTETKTIDIVDYAEDRETPVAKSDVPMEVIQKELGGQDLPLVLNATPGAYVTQQGGGDGDARINIRGFNQRNVAVMIDGIPVNDMENGWVYWSNWFGLDAVTRAMQVQRGLGSSKIAIPSVGGTINIITQGIESRQGITVKQELGNNGFTRTSLGLTTGKMKNGFGITAAGSYKQGNGWADQLYTKGYFYYLKVEKIMGKHILGATAMGAPQEHGQRSFKQAIPTFSGDYGADLGLGDSIRGSGYGYTYNPHWGTYETYTVNGIGDTTRGDMVTLNERNNYYHKPQFTLRDLWQVNDRLYISTVAYLSLGNGGGTGAKNSIGGEQYTADGQINWQEVYDANTGNAQYDNPFLIDFSIDPNFSDTEHKSGQILATSMNNHFWYGGLSTFTFKQTDSLEWSGGIDLRSYTGQHYREVYDLIGGDYYVAPADEYSRNDSVGMLRVGDKFGYHYDGKVNWAGTFAQLEYTTLTLSAFGNVSFALSGYQRIDYFRPKDVVIGDDVFNEAVEYGGAFYYDGATGTGLSAFNGATVTVSGDTTFINNVSADDPDGYVLNAQEYTIDSKEARAAQTTWKYIPGFTVKGGMNYNLNEFNNIYFNTGYISKAQRFNNVINRTNQFFNQIENEKISAIEIGFGRKKGAYLIQLNSYITSWKNKPAATSVPLPDDPDMRVPVNLNGLNALHVGIELESGYKLTQNIELQFIASIGDWRWTSQGTYVIEDPNNGESIDTVQFNAEGIRVGDAAQTQLGFSAEWDFYNNKEKKQNAYLRGRYTYFDNYFADFDPVNFQVGPPQFETYFDANGNPRQSWQIPAYGMLDVHAGFRWKYKDARFDLRGSVLNALDAVYITDANNNDRFEAFSGSNFDAAAAAVFFGQGRRFNVSLRMML